MHASYCGRADGYSLSPIKPQDINDVDLAFPSDIDRLMPAQAEIDQIPKEYLREAEKFVSIWFHLGLDHETRWMPAPGVDLSAALRHLSACMRSFQPKHEDKLLGCAALVSRFFNDVKYRAKDGRGGQWDHVTGFLYETQDEHDGTKPSAG